MSAPAGFREVQKDEFFATVGQLNVHPRPERDMTYWETPRRELMGQSEPGYAMRGDKRWFVSERHFPAKRGDRR